MKNEEERLSEISCFELNKAERGWKQVKREAGVQPFRD